MAARVVQSLGIGEAECRILAKGFWCQSIAVHTRDTEGGTARTYRDVRLWIKLLRTISNHDFSRTGEKRKRVESDTEYDSGTESDTDDEECTSRERRDHGLRPRPTRRTAKKSRADECDLEWLDKDDVKEEEIGEDEMDVDVSDAEMTEDEMNGEDSDGEMQDETMQDGDILDSGDTVMADEEVRPEGRTYVCAPGLGLEGLGVIVQVDVYGTVVDRIVYTFRRDG